MDPEQSAAPATQAGPGPHPPKVDLEALAERVYRLMLAEARLERLRSAGAGGRF